MAGLYFSRVAELALPGGYAAPPSPDEARTNITYLSPGISPHHAGESLTVYS